MDSNAPLSEPTSPADAVKRAAKRVMASEESRRAFRLKHGIINEKGEVIDPYIRAARETSK